jgi:hypothetical protein
LAPVICVIIGVGRIAFRFHVDQDPRQAERELAGQEFVAGVRIQHVDRAAITEIHHDLGEIG